MRSKYIVGVFAFVLLLSTVSAVAKLEIQSLPDHEIFITEIDAYASDNLAVAQPIRTFTGKTGFIPLDYTPQKSTFKLGLLLKDDNGMKIIPYTILDDNFHDNEISKIEFIPAGMNIEDVLALVEEEEPQTVVEANVSEVVSNESEVAEELTDEVVEEDTSEEGNSTGVIGGILIQGHAIYQENKTVMNVISYGLGIALLVVPLFLFFRKRISGKLPLIGGSGNCEDDFEKAEEDLKSARDRLDSLKGKKLSAARQKLLEDEKELMRLRNLGKD